MTGRHRKNLSLTAKIAGGLLAGSTLASTFAVAANANTLPENVEAAGKTTAVNATALHAGLVLDGLTTAKKDLAPGDLVFFYGARSHVGIVSKVKGGKVHMIHSPRTGDHVRQVVLDSYRKQTFNGAVRPY